jgi:hypothetical protein
MILTVLACAWLFLLGEYEVGVELLDIEVHFPCLFPDFLDFVYRLEVRLVLASATVRQTMLRNDIANQ